jgi:hypothetical protein
MFVYVKWNSFVLRLPAYVSDIRAGFALRWPLPPLRPKRAASGVTGLRNGSGQGRIIGRISSERVTCESRRLKHLHYFRVARRKVIEGVPFL